MDTVIDENRALRNIAANVRRLLIDRQWSQGELARRAGEKPMTISRIVNRQHMPELPTIANVAEALQTTVDYLLADPKNSDEKKSA